MMSGIASKAETVEPEWVDNVLRFWFQELSEADWFKKDAGIDARIRERFLALHERLVAQQGLCPGAPRPMLAAVIVLDQFPRNLFRGQARAFEADPIARRIARAAIAAGFDAALSRQERLFLYLPFEHSEDAGDQALALALVGPLGDAEWTRFAEAHKTIIDRFGRFPHRNAALGRVSTPEEIAFLTTPMASF